MVGRGQSPTRAPHLLPLFLRHIYLSELQGSIYKAESGFEKLNELMCGQSLVSGF